jgi:hypothetical protein
LAAKLYLSSMLSTNTNLREVLAYWFRYRLVEKGWSQDRLALECDLDRTYVPAVERCHWNVSLSSIEHRRWAWSLGLCSDRPGFDRQSANVRAAPSAGYERWIFQVSLASAFVTAVAIASTAITSRAGALVGQGVWQGPGVFGIGIMLVSVR